jgi:hypothetical protein
MCITGTPVMCIVYIVHVHEPSMHMILLIVRVQVTTTYKLMNKICKIIQKMKKI